MKASDDDFEPAALRSSGGEISHCRQRRQRIEAHQVITFISRNAINPQTGFHQPQRIGCHGRGEGEYHSNQSKNRSKKRSRRSGPSSPSDSRRSVSP